MPYEVTIIQAILFLASVLVAELLIHFYDIHAMVGYWIADRSREAELMAKLEKCNNAKDSNKEESE